ncbi:MAG: 50S ribosomal protein L25 [Candidatus Levybacteria bacterium]|nr:50S ribosomal protein L25 [Candidatus Levybacteria bacterium]
MQQRHALQAEKRTVLGKAVKKLRRTGFLPANVYGKGLESTAIQVNAKEFNTVYKEAGETGLVDLKVDGEVRPVLIKNLQLEYPLRIPLHVDFYQVNLKEKVKTMVPIELLGEAKAVTEKVGTMIQPLSEIEVEALPTDLPEKIEVNVEPLAALDEQITVADLKIPAGITVLTDPGQVIVKIAELAAPEPEPVVEEAAEGAAEGGEAAEGEAGETGKAEGESEKTEGKEEKTEEKSAKD